MRRGKASVGSNSDEVDSKVSVVVVVVVVEVVEGEVFSSDQAAGEAVVKSWAA